MTGVSLGRSVNEGWRENCGAYGQKCGPCDEEKSPHRGPLAHPPHEVRLGELVPGSCRTSQTLILIWRKKRRRTLIWV